MEQCRSAIPALITNSETKKIIQHILNFFITIQPLVDSSSIFLSMHILFQYCFCVNFFHFNCLGVFLDDIPLTELNGIYIFKEQFSTSNLTFFYFLHMQNFFYLLLLFLNYLNYCQKYKKLSVNHFLRKYGRYLFISHFLFLQKFDSPY